MKTMAIIFFAGWCGLGWPLEAAQPPVRDVTFFLQR